MIAVKNMSVSSIKSDYMDCAHLLPADGYSIRKPGNEVSVDKRAIVLCGGVDRMVQRLVGVYMNMPEHYRGVGFTWFDDGHAFAANLANVYDFTVWQIAQVIAVLSPQNPWEGKIDKNGKRYSDGNQLCTLRVVRAFVEGGANAVMSLKGEYGNWGYAPAFLAKAVRILQGEELDWSGAPKTYRFALLLANPKRTDIAVCDSHASRTATGNLGNRYHIVVASAYPLLEKAYILAGEILGVPAYAVQAGTWQYAVDGHLYGTE